MDYLCPIKEMINRVLIVPTSFSDMTIFNPFSVNARLSSTSSKIYCICFSTILPSMINICSRLSSLNVETTLRLPSTRE